MRFVKIGRRYFFGWQGEKRRHSRGYIEAFQRSQAEKEQVSIHKSCVVCQPITTQRQLLLTDDHPPRHPVSTVRQGVEINTRRQAGAVKGKDIFSFQQAYLLIV